MKMRFLAAALPSLVMVIGSNVAASAEKNYTREEKANMAVVRGLFDALDAAEARGDQPTAIVGIADKYIAADFKVHGNNPRDRAEWIAGFQRGRGPGVGAAGAGGPGAGPPGAGGPGAGPPGAGPVSGPPGAGGPGGGPAGANAGPRQPAHEVAVMADGDKVVYVATRNGETMIYHMLRLKDGKISEEW
jgi:hypothetical protein